MFKEGPFCFRSRHPGCEIEAQPELEYDHHLQSPTGCLRKCLSAEFHPRAMRLVEQIPGQEPPRALRRQRARMEATKLDASLEMPNMELVSAAEVAGKSEGLIATQGHSLETMHTIRGN